MAALFFQIEGSADHQDEQERPGDLSSQCSQSERQRLTLAEVADFLEISVRTVCNIEDNYDQGGLEKALHDDPRPRAPIQFDDRVKSHVVATVCSEPPEGFDRWTLELIRERIVEREVVQTISTETIRLILQEHDLKPWRQQSWCVPKLDEEFIERMEDVLAVYERPADPRFPVLAWMKSRFNCSMKSGQPREFFRVNANTWTMSTSATGRAMSSARWSRSVENTSPK